MDSRLRHISKTITWRIVASGTTFGLTYFFFRDDPSAIEKASGMALVEAGLKMILYYYHERVWFKIKTTLRSHRRHLMKSVTWRLIASLTTFLLAIFFFRDDPLATQKATGVAVVEIFIKMLVYYLHERAWYRINFGLDKYKNKDS